MKRLALIFSLFFCTLFDVAMANSSSIDIDFERLDREVNEILHHDLKQLLSLSLEELMQVEIDTAGKVSEKIGEIPASVVLITRRDIQRYGYTTLDDILKHVSGVYHLNFYGTGGASYGVRGYLSTSTANRNMIILVNGISQVSDYDSSYLLPTVPVPVEAIDRVEIVRGPQSTIYGSGAFFGVINIITNETTQKSGSTSYVSGSGGTGQAQRWFGRSNYVHDQGKIVVNIGSYQHNGLDIPYQRLESKPQGQEWEYSTGGRMESEQKYFELSGSYQNLRLDITHANTDTEGFVSRPAIGKGTNRHVEATHLRVGYQQELSNQLNLNGHLTYIRNDVRLDYDSPFPLKTVDFQEISSTAYEGELTLQWKLPRYLDLTSGIYYRYVPDVTSFVDLPGLPNVASLQKATQRLQSGESLMNGAWFSQMNYYPSKRWKWVAGLRLEQTLGYSAFAEYGANSTQYKSFTPRYDAQKLAVIPRLAAIYTPHEKQIFKWLYGKAINSPSFGQQTSTRLTSELPKLEAEQIETFEFNSITYLSPRHMLTPHYMFSANLFRNSLKNLLERMMIITPAGQYLSFLSNGGEWTTNGLELSFQAQLTDKTLLELSLTYQETHNKSNSDIEAAYSPNLLGQVKFSYQWTPQLTLGLTGYYVSEMQVYFDPTLKNSDGSFGGRINGTNSKDYFTMGANVRFQDWLHRGTFVNVRVNNLLNQEITYPTYLNNSWMDRGAVGEERSVMVTVGYEF